MLQYPSMSMTNLFTHVAFHSIRRRGLLPDILPKKGCISVTDWQNATEEDLTNLIANKTQEDHRLDYKRRESLLTVERAKRRQELGKDVSSFAHADGGTIIYGMVESGKPGVATRLEGFAPSDMTKEQLTQLIQTSTDLPIAGIYVRPVELARSDPGKWAYVVTIPQSETCHQASDMKFHRRDNATTREMHRDEILDILNRARGARLHLAFDFEGARNAPLLWFPTGANPHCSRELTLQIFSHNSGKIALYSLHRLYIQPGDERIAISRYAVLEDDPIAAYPPGAEPNVTRWRKAVRQLQVPRDSPIFPGNRFRLGSILLRVDKAAPSGPVSSKRIFWECVAPDMLNTHGGVLVQREGDNLVLRDVAQEAVEQFFGL